jgi:hypothetical protein
MHTVMVVLGGLSVLGAFVWIGGDPEKPPTMATAAGYFIPVWAAFAIGNMWLGVQGGFTFAQETRVFVIVFGVPAAAAVYVWWSFSV